MNGGAERRDLELARHLRKKHEVDIVIGMFEKSSEIEFEQLVIPRKFNTEKLRGWNNYFSEKTFMKKYAKEFDAYYITHGHKISGKFWFCRVSGDIRQTKTATLLGRLAYAPLKRNKLRNLKKMSAVISCSKQSDYLLLELGQTNIIRSKQFIDTTIFKPPLKKSKGHIPMVLFVGRNDPIKNLANLNRACDSLMVFFITKGCDGWVSKKELAKEYQQADLVVLPSFYESYGIVALESLACGTPVLLSKNVTALDDLKEYVAVCYTSSKSIRLMIKCCLDSKSMKEKTLAGCKFVRKNFDKNKVLDAECCQLMGGYDACSL